MRNYVERAKDFIHQIFPYLKNCNCHEVRKISVLQFNIDYHRRVEYNHGQSRYALATSDYVVKVDYRDSLWGNSEDEMEVYKLAEQDGFAYLFAKITPYEYEGIHFYIMPRIYGVGRYEEDADTFMTSEEADWCYDHVNDLHFHNYGWKNGRVVVFDYASRC